MGISIARMERLVPPTIAILLLVSVADALTESDTMAGVVDDASLESAGIEASGLMPMMNVYNEAKKQAKEAALQADYLKTKGLGDVQATLAGGDGEADASEAAKRAKAAVEGVESAKAAMANAQTMLAAAETAAK